MTSARFKEGTEFAAHKTEAKIKKEPFVIKLPANDPFGVVLYCAAVHDKHELIADFIDADSLLSFAATADEFGGLDKVRKGAELAMKMLSKPPSIHNNVATVLHAALLFNHAEYFGKITDWVAKYRDELLPDLQEVSLSRSNPPKKFTVSATFSKAESPH